MATNPMQRKARNSFLLGMVITLLIAAIIIAFIFKLLTDTKKELSDIQETYTQVYTLSKDVKSGEEITQEDLISTDTLKGSFPTEGVIGPNSFVTIDENGTSSSKKIISKIALKQGTVLTQDMVYIDAEASRDDIRIQEYNMIELPIDLAQDDYIDIRIAMPTGQDFIVASKKQVTIPMINGAYSSETVRMDFSEEETLTMSSAIVEAYILPGTKIYATKYKQPGLQEAAEPTYVPTSEVVSLMGTDKNIVQEAKEALAQRISKYRTFRESQINSLYGDSTQESRSTAVQSGFDESATKTQEERKNYLDSLTPTTIQ